MSKRITQLTELTTAATDDYLPIVDTSSGQTKKITVKNLTGLPDTGWTASGETWTFSSWDATTRIGVITVPSDATTKYTVKNRIRIAQTTGGTKYGIIHKVASTALTVHFPTGITLNNEAITSPVYSQLDSPVGFPGSKNLWLLYFTSSSTTAASGSAAWQNTGSPLLALGIGDWFVKGRVAFQNNGATEHQTALSTSNSSASHDEAVIRDLQASRVAPTLNTHTNTIDSLSLTAAGTVYAIHKSSSSFDNRGDTGTPHVTKIIAYTNYL